MTKKYLIACAATLVLAFGGTAWAGGEQGGEHAEGTQIEQQSGQEQPEQESQAGQQGQQGQQEQGQQGQQAPMEGQQQQSEAGQQEQPGMEGQLSLEQKKQLQRELQEQGFYQGNIDGIVGPQTRAAVRQFQQQAELAGNGQLTQETVDELGLNLQEPVSGAEQEQQMGQQDPSQQQMQPGAAEEPQKFQLSALNEEQTRELQQKLQQHGFYKGEIDGIVGPQTRSALQAYFRDQASLASQGVVTESALNDFGINPSEVQPVRGTEGQGSDWQQQQQQQQQQQPQEEQQQQPPEQQPQQQQEGTPDVDIDVNNPDMGAEPQPAPEGTDEY